MKSLIIVIQFIFVLAFILPAADWHQTSYGKWVVESFENSPFPYSDMTDPAFQDSSVFIFIPDGYLQSANFDLIVDHHGHGAIIDPQNNDKLSYPEKFRQAFQLYESRKNAILIIPQAARNKSSGAAGSFTEMNGFKNFIDEVTVYLKQQKI